MKTILLVKAFEFSPIFAQATGLGQGASRAMGIVMLIGFIFGTICVIGGGFAIRRGDTDAGKLSIIGGLIIAGAPVIIRALFTAFGRSEEHTSELQSRFDLVCRLLLEKKKQVKDCHSATAKTTREL